MSELAAGETVQMKTTGDALVICEKLGEGGQGLVFRAEMGGRPFAVKWYRPSKKRKANDRLYDAISRLVSSGRPLCSAFAWPIDLVESNAHDGFGYVMPLMDKRFISFAQLLLAPDPPDFRMLIKIGLGLVDAFASLHTSGLCYRDISFGNLWVDPLAGDIAIIDNDNVGINGGRGMVKGTPGFMAPEVARDEALPSTETDLYSLAVFLFYLFFFGHPLDGQAVEASFGWDGEHRLSEEEILLKHYGLEPVFVYDPADDTNRPVAGSPVASWWALYPGFFRELFIQSFTKGLTDPTLNSRLTEGVWRKALYRLADCVWECPGCGAGLLFDPAAPTATRCWHCGASPELPLLLSVLGHSIVLHRGAVLTGRHLRLPARSDEPVAVVETDPRYPGSVLLRNKCDQAWTVSLPGAELKYVKPGQRLLARPLTFEPGGKRATIARAGTEPTR